MRLANPEKYYRTLLDAIPIPVLLVDDDVTIIDLNRSAVQFLKKSKDNLLRLRGGEALDCIHTNDDPGGCGKGPACQTCVIRGSVNSAMAGKEVHRERAVTERANRSARSVDFLVTTSPVTMQDTRYALMILEDITELTKLRDIIPMCAHCKRIRDDEQYWQSVDVYLREHHGMNVSHGLCQECLRELYPDQCDEILKMGEERKKRAITQETTRGA